MGAAAGPRSRSLNIELKLEFESVVFTLSRRSMSLTEEVCSRTTTRYFPRQLVKILYPDYMRARSSVFASGQLVRSLSDSVRVDSV